MRCVARTGISRPLVVRQVMRALTNSSVRNWRLAFEIGALARMLYVIAHSTIYFVSPQVDDATQSILAKAPISNANRQFRTDEFVSARITWRTTKGLEIPVLATQRINGQFFTFLAASGPKGTVARQQQIQVGDIIGNNYIVQSGIKPGDHIIVAGFQFLADGLPVKETALNSPPEAASH